MPVKINSISFKNETKAQTTDYLLGAIGDKIVAEIDCKAEWIFTPDTDNFIFFRGDQKRMLLVDSTPSGNGVSWFNYGFFAGDTIVITGAPTNNGTYTIDSISTDGINLTITGTFPTPNEYAPNAVVTGTTECTGLNFRANLIENAGSESYLSLVDNNEIKFSYDGINYNSTTPLNTIQQGVYKSNHLGTVTVEGLSSPELNRFKIKHTFYITPFFLLNQIADFQDLKAPDYFYDLNCLKYAYNVELLYKLNNPNKVHKSTDLNFQLGNTGWFNENFNGGINYYSISQPIFTVGGNVVSFADYNSITDFEITVTSQNGTFSNFNTQFLVTHFYLPESESEYVNTQTDFTTNFLFDRALVKSGFPSENGVNYGGAKQVLEDVSATYISTTQVKITGKINLSSAYKTRVGQGSVRNFVLAVTTEDHTLVTESSDKVCLIPSDLNTYDIDLSNTSVGSANINFFIHPQTDYTSPLVEAGFFLEDDILSRVQFYVDITDNALIDSAEVIIKATHAIFGSFILEREIFSFSGATVVSGVQQINIDQTRGFDLKTGNQFNFVKLNRKSSLDSGNLKYYELFYAFRLRWEYFLQLTGVNSQFYDETQDFNGFNNDWNRYFAATGWSIKFEFVSNVTENGVTNRLSNERNVVVYDYGQADDWSTTKITLFDNTDNTDTGTFLITDNISRIEADITYTGGSLPTINDVEGEIKIERYEQDGYKIIQEISTIWENPDNELLISILGNNKLKKEYLGANVFRLTALIDNTKINKSAGSYKISARIYQTPFAPVGNKQYQDDDYFEFQDAEPYDFMN